MFTIFSMSDVCFVSDYLLDGIELVVYERIIRFLVTFNFNHFVIPPFIRGALF